MLPRTDPLKATSTMLFPQSRVCGNFISPARCVGRLADTPFSETTTQTVALLSSHPSAGTLHYLEFGVAL
jgi:hypothetical protein